MPITAIRYGIKAGCEDEIAEIFAGFERTGSPSVLDADGNEVGRILSTAVFIENDIMVRFVEYEGDLADIARFMATQPGVREVERRLKPYLARPRDTGSVEGFTKTFAKSTMRCISQLSADKPDTP